MDEYHFYINTDESKLIHVIKCPDRNLISLFRYARFCEHIINVLKEKFEKITEVCTIKCIALIVTYIETRITWYNVRCNAS